MAKLNERTEQTKRIIHLMITEKCNRKCPDCCNNQYDLDSIERATDKELSECEMVFLTGGEPFLFADPCGVAKDLKERFSNIKKVFVYTNALELKQYLEKNDLYAIDGLTISIKNHMDKIAFEDSLIQDIDGQVTKLESNRVYVFPTFFGWQNIMYLPGFFDLRMREWQKDFVPAPDSIFRRL